MRHKYFQLLIFSLLFISCDPSGNLFLTNGFKHDVIVYTIYDHNNSIIDRIDTFSPEVTFDVAAMGHIEYSYINSI